MIVSQHIRDLVMYLNGAAQGSMNHGVRGVWLPEEQWDALVKEVAQTVSVEVK